MTLPQPLKDYMRPFVSDWTQAERDEALRIASAINAVFGVDLDWGKWWAFAHIELLRDTEPPEWMNDQLSANAIHVASKTGKDLDVCRDAMRPIVTWQATIGTFSDRDALDDASRISELNRYFVKFRNSLVKGGIRV